LNIIFNSKSIKTQRKEEQQKREQRRKELAQRDAQQRQPLLGEKGKREEVEKEDQNVVEGRDEEARDEMRNEIESQTLVQKAEQESEIRNFTLEGQTLDTTDMGEAPKEIQRDIQKQEPDQTVPNMLTSGGGGGAVHVTPDKLHSNDSEGADEGPSFHDVLQAEKKKEIMKRDMAKGSSEESKDTIGIVPQMRESNGMLAESRGETLQIMLPDSGNVKENAAAVAKAYATALSQKFDAMQITKGGTKRSMLGSTKGGGRLM
jgi:hypothetical protein